jgi:hypothetical protein
VKQKSSPVWQRVEEAKSYDRKERIAMSQPRIARQKRNEKSESGESIRKTLLVLGTVFLIWTAQANAQLSLADVVAEAGFDWMIGKWVATTDDGDQVQLVYKWELAKHLVTIQFKMRDYEYRGMIFYVPAKEEVVQVAVDNRGGNGKGLWEPDGDKAIMKIEHTGTDGETNRMGLVHSKVNAETMKVGMYAVESTGELAEEPWATLEYKLQRPKTRKKDR